MIFEKFLKDIVVTISEENHSYDDLKEICATSLLRHSESIFIFISGEINDGINNGGYHIQSFSLDKMKKANTQLEELSNMKTINLYSFLGFHYHALYHKDYQVDKFKECYVRYFKKSELKFLEN